MYFKKITLILISSLFTLINTNSKAQVFINEIQTSNSQIVDTSTGNYSDWLEIYNSNTSDFDISLYYLTDNFKQINKWRFPTNTIIPANGYLVVWADKLGVGLHTNYGLSSTGEVLGLYDISGDLVDSVTFGSLETNVSYARKTDGNAQWNYVKNGSFGIQNSVSNISEFNYSLLPEIDLNAGFYIDNQEVIISGGDSIYYTLDGSIPNPLTSSRYITAIALDKTTVLKAMSFENGKLPSNMVTKTYFINEPIQLPVLSISTDPKNLHDNQIGALVVGTNGKTVGNITANYWNDWEREVTIEYFEDKKLKLQQNAGFSVIGANRDFPQKSFRLDSRGKYGSKTFDYPFFKDKSIRLFTTLLLRSGGLPDYRSTFFRDYMCQYMAAEALDVDYQGYQASVLFVNGAYYGIYNICEKTNENYLSQNFGVDANKVDILEDLITPLEGTNTDFIPLYTQIIGGNSNDSLTTQLIFDNIDVQNFVDYHLTEIFFANHDWPGRNQLKWKEKTTDAKWRWILNDMDGAAGIWAPFWANSFEYATDTTSLYWSNHKDYSIFIRKVLLNDSIKSMFIKRADAVLNSIYSKESFEKNIEHYQSIYESEAERHIAKWFGACDSSSIYNQNGCIFETKQEWIENINHIKQFADQRPEYFRNYLIDFYDLSGVSSFEVGVNDTLAGYITINDIKINPNLSSYQLFNDVNQTIEAIPLPGYRFNGWKNNMNELSNTYTFVPSTSGELYAYFVKTEEIILGDTLRESLVLNNEGADYLINHDLIIPANTSLTINKGVQIRIANQANILVNGQLIINGTADDKVTIKANKASGFDTWGVLMFIDASDSSYLKNLVVENATIGYDIFRDKGAISCWKSTVYIDSSEIIDVENQPIFGQESNVFLSHSTIHSKVTGDLINIKRGYAAIDNCIFLGNNKVDTDAIDYDGIDGGWVKNSKIHSFFGFNSDGVDLGEGSKNILLENLEIYDCTDKGVSVGQASTGIIKRNLIYACNLGIGIKDSASFAYVENNTFYGNTFGVSAYEKNVGKGGGNAFVTNSIFAHSDTTIYFDHLSNIEVSYSLSDKELLAGQGNRYAKPNFVFPNFSNFHLKQSSPAIHAGNPSTLDSDLSIVDMGALAFEEGLNFDTLFKNLSINEISSSNLSLISDEKGKFEDWIEIYNGNDFVVDLAGLCITDSLPNPELWHIKNNKPKQTRVPANGYLILWADGDTLDGANHLGFKLSSLGEQVGLACVQDSHIVWIDSLSFGAMANNISFGRKEDANNQWVNFNTPTPNSTNNSQQPQFDSKPNIISYLGHEYKYLIKYSHSESLNTNHSLPQWLTIDDLGNGTAILYGTPTESTNFINKITLNLTNEIHQEFNIYVLESSTITALLEKSENTLTVFPNPFNEYVVFDSNLGNKKTNFKIQISNELGQIIETYTPNEKETAIYTSKWKNGLYFAYLIENETVISVQKLVKMN